MHTYYICNKCKSYKNSIMGAHEIYITFLLIIETYYIIDTFLAENEIVISHISYNKE